MKTLTEVLEDKRTRYQKIKDLYNSATIPGEKAAAKAMLDKMPKPKLDASKFGKWSGKVSQEPGDGSFSHPFAHNQKGGIGDFEYNFMDAWEEAETQAKKTRDAKKARERYNI